jgi:hypothetical protein
MNQGFEDVSESLAAFHDGSKNLRPLLLTAYAESCLDVGKSEEGFRAVDEALDLACDTGIHAFDAELHRLRGELLLRQASANRTAYPYAEVEACLEQSIKISRQQKSPIYELRATIDLAKLLLKQNQGSEAYRRLRESYQSIHGIQNIPDVWNARALLEELSSVLIDQKR